jgi:hypothetical protein
MNIKETVFSILMILSLLLAIALTLWYVFGDSPTLTQLIFGIVMPFALSIFGIYERLNNKIYQTREIFQKELGIIKQTLGKIEGKLK